MPYICTQTGRGLGLVELEENLLSVTGDTEQPLAHIEHENWELDLEGGGILAQNGEKWFHVQDPTRGQKVTINGDMSLGLHRIRHRDELRVRKTRLHLIDEDPARVQPFPGREPVICPRCRTEIMPGEPSVRCPNPQCRSWHHQTTEAAGDEDEKPCWTYGKKCAAPNCSHPTSLDGSFSWLPED